MSEQQIRTEIDYLNKVRLSQIASIEFWVKKLAVTNQNIYNLEIDLIFEQAKETNLKTAIDGNNK